MKTIYRILVLAFINLIFIALTSIDAFAVSDVRIYEIYGGGGNSGATFEDDFIVLYNSSSVPVSMNGWSLQYAAAASSTWSKLDFPAITILAKGFILVRISTSGTVGASLPPSDLLWPGIPGADGLSQSNGKIALMPNTTLITTSAPVSPVDFVGYGTANAFEGSAAAPSPITSVRGIVRKQNPGDLNPVDTDNNSSDFVLTSSSAPSILRPSNSSSFPIKLTYFTAQVTQNTKALINWQTSSEIGFSHFELQRSGDARSFEMISTQLGKTDIAEKNDYQFLDEAPLNGQNYYRLKQVDIDGTIEYSKIISLNVLDDLGIRFFPNPASNTLDIQGLIPADIEHVQVFDSNGRLLKTYFPSQNSLDISAIAPQVMLIETRLRDGSIYKKRIVKQ